MVPTPLATWPVAEYPLTWPATITGAVNDLRLYAYKTADEVLGNSTVYQNDDQLVVPVEANHEYFGQMLMMCDSDAAADIKYQLTFPAGATLYSHAYLIPSPITLAAASTAEVSMPTAGVGNVMPLLTWFAFATAAAAGNLQVQWAKFAAHASNTTVRRGSWIRIWPAT